MNFDSWINRPSSLMEQIQDAEEEVMRCQSRCERTTINYGEEYIKTSRTDSVTKNILELDEAEKKLDTLYQEYFDTIEELREFIYENLPRKQADVLDWRYCHVMTVEKIAEKKKMTKTGVYGACSRALANLKKSYIEKNQNTERNKQNGR